MCFLHIITGRIFLGSQHRNFGSCCTPAKESINTGQYFVIGLMVTYPMFRARLIYRSRNGKTPLKGEHRLARSMGLLQPSGCEGARPLYLAHSWARRPARTYTATTRGTGLWHASQRARPRPLSRAPTRAGQHARTPWNILYGATRRSARITWCVRAPGQGSAGDGYSRTWAPD